MSAPTCTDVRPKSTKRVSVLQRTCNSKCRSTIQSSANTRDLRKLEGFMEAAVCGPPGAELGAWKRTSSSSPHVKVAQQRNKPHKTLLLFTAFSASDVQPTTWIYQPLLDLDPDPETTSPLGVVALLLCGDSKSGAGAASGGR